MMLQQPDLKECNGLAAYELWEQAANLGGDADTIAAITGRLAGALYGYEEIPLRWRTALDNDTKSTLLSLTDNAVKNHTDR